MAKKGFPGHLIRRQKGRAIPAISGPQRSHRTRLAIRAHPDRDLGRTTSRQLPGSGTQRRTVNVTSNWEVPPFLGFSLPP